MALPQWIEHNRIALRKALILVGMSALSSAIFLSLVMLDFTGHLSVLRRLPLAKAWNYLAAHQNSKISFDRMRIIWPVVSVGLLVMAICELVRPLQQYLNWSAAGFWGRVATSLIGLATITFFMISSILAFGNFLPGQSLFTGFPSQTLDRIFVHHSVIFIHHGFVRHSSINWIPVVCISIWLWVCGWVLVLMANDIREHRRKRRQGL